MTQNCSDWTESPCIDAGTSEITDQIQDCLHGLGGNRSDMGAYGGYNARWQTETEIGHPLIPDQAVLLRNYPNPFNVLTVIEYSLPSEGSLSISVYNLLGQRVAILCEGPAGAGKYRIRWDASALPSGIYLARLESAGYSSDIKMLLLK